MQQKMQTKLPLGTVNADELARKLCPRIDGRVDSVGLSSEVWIEAANYDAGMVGIGIMQVDKMLAINCHKGPAFGSGRSQYLFVRH
jgi:hypothetical protein